MKIAYLRFYEELNNFLPKEKKKIKFKHKFNNNPSIKDMIESFGIPHIQVDLILINNKSVDFSYIVQNGDDISVYPIFESMNIKKVSQVREEPLRVIKFVVDVHLGKLTRYLRMLGFDTLYQNDYNPGKIIKISKSEKRIILSKSRQLLKIKDITHGYCITDSDPEKQLKKVLNRFDLINNLNPFSRCMICNGKLESVDKEQIIDKIPEKVKESQQEFAICPNCKKIYWKGTHFESMLKFIDEHTKKSSFSENIRKRYVSPTKSIRGN